MGGRAEASQAVVWEDWARPRREGEEEDSEEGQENRPLKKSKKKKSLSSGSSSRGTTSSSDSSGPVTSVGLFEGEKKLGVIWKKCPGALACSAATEAKQQLLTASGTVWGLDRKKVDPVFTHYVRQCLMGHMSPPMGQEALTVAQTLDLMLQGHAAAACDVMAQRLKSLEASSRGSHWTMSRQLELVRSDGGTIAEEAESREAARRARQEEQLRSLTARPAGPRNYEAGSAGKGGRKGKEWKGASKGKSEEGGRGKGGERRDEGKGWQKEKKWMRAHFQVFRTAPKKKGKVPREETEWHSQGSRGVVRQRA